MERRALLKTLVTLPAAAALPLLARRAWATPDSDDPHSIIARAIPIAQHMYRERSATLRQRQGHGFSEGLGCAHGYDHVALGYDIKASKAWSDDHRHIVDCPSYRYANDASLRVVDGKLHYRLHVTVDTDNGRVAEYLLDRPVANHETLNTLITLLATPTGIDGHDSPPVLECTLKRHPKTV